MDDIKEIRRSQIFIGPSDHFLYLFLIDLLARRPTVYVIDISPSSSSIVTRDHPTAPNLYRRVRAFKLAAASNTGVSMTIVNSIQVIIQIRSNVVYVSNRYSLSSSLHLYFFSNNNTDVRIIDVKLSQW
jgi:hypothetical protein